jgi:prepilin-type N-terminal cleavage/methylation domain-containing protein
MKYYSKKNNKGFTLIEMLVAVGLFAVVMLISTAVIFSIINGNRKSQTINTVVNNLNFSLESMIRDMKTGYWYQCNDYLATGWPTLEDFKNNYMHEDTNPSYYLCPSGSKSDHISFVSTISGDGRPRIVEYHFKPGLDGTPGQIYKAYKDYGDPTVTDSPLTTPDMGVSQFDLYISNPPPANVSDKLTKGFQPSVFLIVKGNAKIGNKDTDVSSFGVQTYISQRLLNI